MARPRGGINAIAGKAEASIREPFRRAGIAQRRGGKK
jgi:hypothetical protein